MKNTIFTGAGVAIVTPMNSDLTVNYDLFGKLIDFQLENGTDAIIVTGTTGESSTLSEQEHIECIKFTVDHVNHRVPVIAGTGSNSTETAIMLSKEAEKCGADALLVVTPYYNKTSQKGLALYFTAIADSVDIPVILYNVPSRTGMNIDIATYKALQDHPNIVAVKEASGNISYAAKIAAETTLDIYSGNDDIIVPMMSLGAKGVISVLSNCLPRVTHEMAQFCLDNDFNSATKLQLKYLDFINSLFCDVNPIPVKEALNIMGWNVGECRLPLCKMDDVKIDKLKKSMKNAGIIN